MAEKYAGLTLGVDVSQVNNAVKSLQQFKKANDDAKKSVNEFVDSEVVARQQAKQFAEELARQKAEFKKIQESIDPTASKMDKLRKAATQLDALWKKGIVPDETFFELGAILETQQNKLIATKKAMTEEGRAALEESKNKARAAEEAKKFIQALREQEEAAGKSKSELLEMKAAQLGVSQEAAPYIARLKEQEKQIQKLGISTGQYNQAMKLLPMQITDVVTSLASGMPVWLVAIQQGGQIKDSFGGASNALKALLSFLNPVNVAFGLLSGTLAIAAYNAYKTQTEFEAIKKTIQETTGLTGDFAEKIATGIQELSDKTGESAEDLAKAYITTKDGASEAIKKLVDVGMTYDDAKKKVNEYKGASSFVGLNNDIANHKNKILELGESWYEVLKAKRDYASPSGGLLGKELGYVNPMLKFALNTYEDIGKVVKDANKDMAERAERIDKENLALNRVRAAQEALNKAIEDQKGVARSADEELKKRAAENVEFRRKELEEIKKQEQKKKEAKGGIVRGPTEQLDKELYVLKAQLETLKEHRTVNDVISRQRKSLWSIEKQIEILEDAQSKRKLTGAEQALLNEQKSVLEMARQKAELGDQIVLQERKNKLEQDSIKFIRETQAAIDVLGLKQLGYTEKQIERELELRKLRTDYEAQGGSVSDEVFQQMEAKLKQYYQTQDEVQGNWLAGAKNAWELFAEDANNAYGNVQQIASEALNGLTNQLANFIATGKANFKDFSTAIIKMIIQMITKMVVFNALSGLMGGQTWTMGSLLKNIGGFAGGGYTGDGGKYEPAGIVHKGEFVMTKEATQRIGVGNLYRMMRGYANGGVVGSSGYTGGGAVTGGAPQFNIGGIDVSITNGNDPKGIETGVKMIFTDMIKRSCMQGGEVYEFVMSKRG
ncbi:tail tape-measure protein [Escherichia phage vB_Eco_mar001J1]|uniref:Tail tape-measure protein n=2 Tax=Warwickvirus TaxID=2732068 RepID=A0A3P4A7H5_9CAUD|nr:tail length tape measure protein [Escherichia phage vB_Eco_mar001J1]YP_009824692.1 tail length tape measure protein [Escherichia phage vB_Eco_mar001J1]VCU43573.1 tail tape-measure protein [Escherichia phage vB_Eco_mar001J1]VCU43677.1 tail tape-measure protein [Escherichia phage vB_Eco_mar001J1]